MRMFGIPSLQISVGFFLGICAEKMPTPAFWAGIALAVAAGISLFGGLIAFGKAVRSEREDA